MAGKASVFASRPLAWTLDKLSKNTLIDLVVDRARAEIGETASDTEILALVQGWIGPVQRERGDKSTNLEAVRAHLMKANNKHRQLLIDNGRDPATLPPAMEV